LVFRPFNVGGVVVLDDPPARSLGGGRRGQTSFRRSGSISFAGKGVPGGPAGGPGNAVILKSALTCASLGVVVWRC